MMIKNLIELINEINNELWISEDNNKEEISISELHMHKILFILYGKFVNKFKKELFKPNFEAWKYGPVEINYRLYTKGNTSLKKNFDIKCNLLKEEMMQLKEWIIKLLKTSAWMLVGVTHENEAWNKAFDENKKNNKMDNKLIQKSFDNFDFN